MGILNVTPDSFSDGGRLYAAGSLSRDKILAAARQMVVDGAQIIDIGGESTRPGAAPVSLDEELSRVVPAVELINSELDVVISVDSSSPQVFLESASRGAGMLNDVRALSRPGAIDAGVATGLPVCLMHMQGQPSTMQARPEYDDVAAEVEGFLLERVEACLNAGFSAQQILLDPGFGFGKSVAHNLNLLNSLPRFRSLGFHVLAGLSRKSLLDKITGRGVEERLAGSITLAALAAERGAAILRVHDVKETVDAVAVVTALREMSD